MPTRAEKQALKRQATESTPDRERAAGTKVAARGSQEIAAVPDFPMVEKVEMSAALIATLRNMMRETLDERLGATEGRMDATMENLRQQLEEEKTARQKEVETLTARIEKLEINATAAGGHGGNGAGQPVGRET